MMIMMKFLQNYSIFTWPTSST